jgi:ribonuclease HII
MRTIIGVDEAGRGPLFGRVYSAAVIIAHRNPEIKDSKKLSSKKIKELACYIKEHAIAWKICWSSEQEIDEMNILQATMKSMRECITELNVNDPEKYIICVDGPYFNRGNIDPMLMHKCVPGGDSLIYEISCAGILAKDARDNYIHELCLEEPSLCHYDIYSNKGYGAKTHIDAIKRFGITKWHRKSFGPCKSAPMLAKIKFKKIKSS